MCGAEYTDLTQSEVTQRQSIHYAGSVALLRHVVMQLAGTIDFLTETRWRLYGCVDLTLDNEMIILEVQTLFESTLLNADLVL
jgi:cleavage and polyadenylation specificity factor subunit 3